MMKPIFFILAVLNTLLFTGCTSTNNSSSPTPSYSTPVVPVVSSMCQRYEQALIESKRFCQNNISSVENCALNRLDTYHGLRYREDYCK